MQPTPLWAGPQFRENSITVNDAPAIAPQPVEASVPQPVAVPPQPSSNMPRPLAVPPQPVAIVAPQSESPSSTETPSAAVPSNAPFKAGQPETANVSSDADTKSEDDSMPKSFDLDETPQISNAVLLQGLNKVTGHISKIDSPLGVTQHFGNLEIIPRRCWKSSPEERPEDAVLLEIRELQVGEASKRIFLGWMFSSSPGLSGLEHPVYDISVVSCEFHADLEKVAAPVAKPAELTHPVKSPSDKKSDKPAKKSPAKSAKKPASKPNP